MRATFTDDRDNAESLTSVATETVAQAPSPLTVSLENAAASHNGTDVFTFEIRFSEQFGLSYKTLRDDAFTVVGGEVKKAQRMDSDSDTPNTWWLITVEPDGNGDVAVTLPATTGLHRRWGHLHGGRQNALQPAGVHRQRSGPIAGNKRSPHMHPGRGRWENGFACALRG